MKNIAYLYNGKSSKIVKSNAHRIYVKEGKDLKPYKNNTYVKVDQKQSDFLTKYWDKEFSFYKITDNGYHYKYKDNIISLNTDLDMPMFEKLEDIISIDNFFTIL